MLFTQPFLDGIQAGRITVAFRRWVRPTVREGGSLKTPIGVLRIDSLNVIDPESLTQSAAQQAGYDSLQELVEALQGHSERPIYRIDFHLEGPDPRIALREQADLSDEDVQKLRDKLARFDKSSPSGAWTHQVLQLIRDHPATLAAVLAKRLGRETASFKNDVRKLKELGLTESLDIGYRLSPRGARYLEMTSTGGDFLEGPTPL